MISTQIKQEPSLLITGPAGRLEVVISTPTIHTESKKIVGFLCHPHPLYGGTMQNKVITTLARALQNLGVTAVRFNFRGVGKSEGQYDHGVGEVEDLLAVVAWAKAELGYQNIWLGGFSFGGYIAARAATLIEIKQLITIAPAVQHFPMTDLPMITCPWILVQGERDDVVPAEAVYTWANSRNPKPQILRFKEAGHFFHGMLGELRVGLEEALRGI